VHPVGYVHFSPLKVTMAITFLTVSMMYIKRFLLDDTEFFHEAACGFI
jgi:hypothetical protein